MWVFWVDLGPPMCVSAICGQCRSGSYLSQEPPKKIGAWGPNRSCDIDLPTPHLFAQLGLVFGHWHSAHGCVNTSQVVYNVPICLRNLQKNLVHASTMRSEHNSISEVITPDPLGVYVPAHDPLWGQVPAPGPLGVKRYLCTACFRMLHTQISHLENSMSAPYQVPTTSEEKFLQIPYTCT